MIMLAKLLMTALGVVLIFAGAGLAVAFSLLPGTSPWSRRKPDLGVIVFCLAVALVGAGFVLQAVLS